MIAKVIIILLCLIIVGILFYFLRPPSKKYLYDRQFRAAAKELEEQFKNEREKQIKLQSEQIQQEINSIEIQLKEKCNHYTELQNQWSKRVNELEQDYEEKKKGISLSLQDYTTTEQQSMAEQLLKKQKEVDGQLREIEEKYRAAATNYNDKLEKVKLEFEQEEQELNSKIEEKRKEINTLIEQFKKDEEAREETDFYRIPISNAAKEDIAKLKTVATQLNNPVVLYKLIWENYFKNGFDQMIGRVLGKNVDKSGIYKITNIKNQMCYIGQAANIKTRWRTHCRRAVRAEEGTSNKLYQVMWEEGLENFTFQVVEFCSKDKLTEREKFFISFYSSKEFGYNSKT